MKKFYFRNFVLFIICLVFLFASPGYAGNKEDVAVESRSIIKITKPQNEEVVPGYFLPVSWTDAVVEQSKLSYPDNYSRSPRKYYITISDLDGNTVLKQEVTGLNYYVFVYDEIKDVLEQKTYQVQVVQSNARELQVSDAADVLYDSVTFIYQKPMCDTPYEAYEDEVLNNLDSSSQMDSLSTGTMSMTSMSAYSSCPYCRTYYWPGYIVVYVNATTYNKNIQVRCNQTLWYNKTVAASHVGPVFLYISSGNYTLTYSDGTYSTTRCVDVYPWNYTILQF